MYTSSITTNMLMNMFEVPAYNKCVIQVWFQGFYVHRIMLAELDPHTLAGPSKLGSPAGTVPNLHEWEDGYIFMFF